MDDFFSQHIQRGCALLELQRYKEAENFFRKALSIHPDVGLAHTALADAIRRQKDITRHKEAYREAHLGVVHDPENAMTYLVLGQTLCAMDRLDEAKKVLRKAVELSPNDAEYHALLGAVLLDLHRVKEARQELRLALDLDPENRWGLYFSALLEGSQGQVNEAASYTKQLLHAAPDDAESHIALGQILMQTGFRKSAEEAFRDALRIDPNNQDAYVGLLKTQKGVSSKVFLLFIDVIHCLFRFRWALGLVVMASFMTMARSCHWMEPQPDKNTMKYILPNNEQK